MHYSRPDIFSVEHWFGSHWARGSKKQISFKKTAVILKSLDGTEQYYLLFLEKSPEEVNTFFRGGVIHLHFFSKTGVFLVYFGNVPGETNWISGLIFIWL